MTHLKFQLNAVKRFYGSVLTEQWLLHVVQRHQAWWGELSLPNIRVQQVHETGMPEAKGLIRVLTHSERRR